MRVKAFKALRPPVELAAQVASPPYDVMDSAEAKIMAAGNPKSFLHVIKPEIDLPDGQDLYADEVYTKAKENFEQFQTEGYLKRDEAAHIYLYQQSIDGHTQTGFVGLCHVDDYNNNIIKKHENTLKKKEDDRTRHVKTLMANAGPVFLTFRDHAVLQAVIDEETAKPATNDFVAEDGVRHILWLVEDASKVEALFGEVPCAYVADGHHRSASAARVGKECADANPAHDGTEAYNWYLCVLFPESQLNVLAYNRVVKDLQGLSSEDLLAKAREAFKVEEVADGNTPNRSEIRMYTAGQWYKLTWAEDPSLGPVESLDVSVLQNNLLSHVLGIEDPKNDPRIYFVGGIHGAERLQADVDSGKGAVSFSLYPVAISQVMDVSDAGKNMPPKSTWFEPKLRSGLVVNKLN